MMASPTATAAGAAGSDPRLDEYAKKGFAIYRDVLDQSLMAEVAAHVDWLRRKHPTVRPENLNEKLAHGDPFWLRLVSDPRLLDIAERFIGPDIALFQSHYICKDPGEGQPVLWHQVRQAARACLPAFHGRARKLR